jgi:hypothetical protein
VLPGAVIGWDMSAALALGDALGVPPLAMAELLPVIEAVMVAKLNEQMETLPWLRRGSASASRPWADGRCAPSWKASARPARAASAGSAARWRRRTPGSRLLAPGPGRGSCCGGRRHGRRRGHGPLGLQTVDAQAKLAQSLGTTVASIQTLERAGELAGVSMSGIEQATKDLTRRLSQAAAGTGPAARCAGPAGALGQ